MAKKQEKTEVKNKMVTKKPANKSINWDSMGDMVTVIALKGKHMTEGKEYTVTKEKAQLFVKYGSAKLK